MSKILYAAGTMGHINNFHLPYIEALRKDGHEVLVMARGEGADFDIPFEKKMFSLKNLSCQRKIKKILKREKFDVILTNTTLAAFNVRIVLPRRNRPRVVNFVHGYMFPTEVKGVRNKIFRFCEKILRKKTDAIMVMNASDYGIANEYKLCREEVRMTLGMGAKVYDAPTVETDLILKANRADGKYILCFVGELYKRKNQRMLICALPEIKLAIPNAVLWLVGDGVARRELVELAESLNISDSVYFMGMRDNPCDYIRAADVYVSASEKEGLPFNILEALGCGKCVVASDVKGQCDIIEDGVSGFLYPYNNVGEFVRKIKKIHAGELSIDPARAVARYEAFSFDRVFDRTYSTMKELIEK